MAHLPDGADVTELTRAKPKGRLLEFCARARCAPPEIPVERTATLSGASMILVLGAPCSSTAREGRAPNLQL